MNICFLDIDGVLNSRATFRVLGNSRPETPNFNEISVCLIDELCKELDLKVYLHSTWINHASIEELRKMFIDVYAVEFQILDRAPQRRIQENRADRIFAGLKKYNPDKYVVIDDDLSIERAFKDSFVGCDFDRGFGWEEYCKVLKLFDKKEPLIL